jgi:hypothetical protein
MRGTAVAVIEGYLDLHLHMQPIHIAPDIVVMGRRGRDRMVIGFTTIYVTNTHHLSRPSCDGTSWPCS